jgi:hypothetical protein
MMNFFKKHKKSIIIVMIGCFLLSLVPYLLVLTR